MKKSLLLFSLLLAVTFADAQLSGYYKQGFEDSIFPPQGWSVINITNSGAWFRSFNIDNPHAISSSPQFAETRGIDYLIAPQFTVKAGDSLTFQLKTNDLELYHDLDTLLVQASVTNADSSDFTTTLASYSGNNYPPGDTWKRIALDLSAFAGKNIYIAFKHDVGVNVFSYPPPSAYILIDSITIGTPPSKDIKALNINVEPFLGSGFTITPKAIFQNTGSETQTFNVTLTAGAYSSTKAITLLAPQYTQQVSFDDFTLPSVSGDINFIAYSSLAGDTLAYNDTTKKTCSIIQSFASKGWIISQDMPVVDSSLSFNAVTTYYNGISPNDSAYIYSIGGVTDIIKGKLVNYNYEFNVKTKTWKSLHPMPDLRAGGIAYTYKDKIYYFGGFVSDSSSGYVTYHSVGGLLIYNIQTDTWNDILNSSPLNGFASCQYHDSLFYFIGQYDAETNDYYNTVCIYNAASGIWSDATEFPELVSPGMRAGIVNNTIVTVGEGHFSYKGVIDLNDPKKITWTQIEDYPGDAIESLGAASINNIYPPLVYFTSGVISIDGQNNTFLSKGTYAYNITTQKWERGPDKPTAVANINSFTPFVFHDTLYIASVGGNNEINHNIANEWLAIGATSGVLAEHLISFTAILQNNKTLLNWKVSEDGSGGYYVIQRAADAVHFADISSRTNAGKAHGVKSYTGYDELPLKGYNYYRIKTVNADGSITYSAIKAVNNISLSSITASVYPNPTHGLLNVVLQHNNGSDAIISIAISDIAGRRIINENRTVNGSLNLSYNLKPGTYVVNLSSKDGTFKQSRKIVVE